MIHCYISLKSELLKVIHIDSWGWIKFWRSEIKASGSTGMNLIFLFIYNKTKIDEGHKLVAKYPKLCVTVEPILLDFPSSYTFSYVHYLLSKQRSTMNIECGDLWPKLTNLQPNIHDLLCAHQTHPFHLKIIWELKIHLHW